MEQNIKKVINRFLNKEVSKFLLIEIKKAIMFELRKTISEVFPVDFSVEKGYEKVLYIKPKNLYSFLALNGIYVPFKYLIGKKHYEKDGVVYGFDDGAYYTYQKVSVNNISVEVTITK